MTPAQDRNLDHLNQLFRTPLERWLAAARAWCQGRGLQILVYETFRTAERQVYLFAQGRTRPGAVITYTLDSSHEYGLAADWVPLRLMGGHWVQDWSHETYAAVYAAVPPGQFGLETFSWEKPHVQLAGVNGATQQVSGSVWAAAHGIKVNVVVGSTWPLKGRPVPAPAPAAPRRRVFLRNPQGKNEVMTLTSALYNGQVVSRLDDGRVQVGSSLITLYPDGAMQFDRVKT